MDKKTIIALAMTSAASLTATNSVKAAGYKCKGVALKGVNGCGANGHDCAYLAKKDWDKNEWLDTKNEEACKSIKKALSNPDVKKYVQMVRNEAVQATMQGKLGKK